MMLDFHVLDINVFSYEYYMLINKLLLQNENGSGLGSKVIKSNINANLITRYLCNCKYQRL